MSESLSWDKWSVAAERANQLLGKALDYVQQRRIRNCAAICINYCLRTGNDSFASKFDSMIGRYRFLVFAETPPAGTEFLARIHQLTVDGQENPLSYQLLSLRQKQGDYDIRKTATQADAKKLWTPEANSIHHYPALPQEILSLTNALNRWYHPPTTSQYWDIYAMIPETTRPPQTT